MSKTIQGTLIAAVLLIIIATILDSTLVAGGSGVVLTVGLLYAFVVNKRDIERSKENTA